MINKLSYKKQRKLVIVLFLLIPVSLLVLFTYVPAMNMAYLSFFQWNGTSPTKTWVGFSNYIKIFSSPEYIAAFKNSLYYFFGGILQLIIAIYFAVLLNTKIKGKSIFKAIFFFPYLINSVAISLIFLFFFQPGGTLDSVLTLLGIESLITQWLGNDKVINYSLAFTSIWRYIGFNFVIFLGAIQSVPTEVLEAAEIDGATGIDRLRYIILPSIKRVVQLSLILNVSGAISAFEIPYIMTGGANGSSTFVIETVNTAFKYLQVGLGSAMAVVVLIIVIITTIIQKKVIKVEEA